MLYIKVSSTLDPCKRLISRRGSTCAMEMGTSCGQRRRRAGIGGGFVAVWIDKAEWQVEGIANYGPNMVSFLLNPGLWRWFVVGAYMSPNDAPTAACVK